MNVLRLGVHVPQLQSDGTN